MTLNHHPNTLLMSIQRVAITAGMPDRSPCCCVSFYCGMSDVPWWILAAVDITNGYWSSDMTLLECTALYFTEGQCTVLQVITI